MGKNYDKFHVEVVQVSVLCIPGDLIKSPKIFSAAHLYELLDRLRHMFAELWPTPLPTQDAIALLPGVTKCFNPYIPWVFERRDKTLKIAYNSQEKNAKLRSFQSRSYLSNAPSPKPNPPTTSQPVSTARILQTLRFFNRHFKIYHFSPSVIFNDYGLKELCW